MSSLNKVQLIGRLGKDPETRQAGGSNVANFSIATSEKWKDKQGVAQELTTWHNIVAWGRLADTVSKYLIKGSFVYIEGSLKTETWEKDGKKQYATKIQAFEIRFLGGTRENRSGAYDEGAGFHEKNGDFNPAPFNTSEEVPF